MKTIINETDRTSIIRLSVGDDGDLMIDTELWESIWVDREQAAQLAEVLKRYSETGRIDE